MEVRPFSDQPPSFSLRSIRRATLLQSKRMGRLEKMRRGRVVRISIVGGVRES